MWNPIFLLTLVTGWKFVSSDTSINPIESDVVNGFSLRFFKELSSNAKGNVFTSPISAQLALALTYTGAGGDTAKEIADALGLPDKDKVLTGFEALSDHLNNNSALSLATAIFIEKSFGVKQEFLDNSKYFKAKVELQDFNKHSEVAKASINNWVEEKTRNKIKDLFKEISPETKLILVNAIYFKDSWKFPFPTEFTHKGKFYLEANNYVETDIMQTDNAHRFSYNAELKAKILELPYKSDISMYIILPDKVDGLSEVESKLDNIGNFDDVLNGLANQRVEVRLPKFKIVPETIDLRNVLEALDIKRIFQRGANFSGISDARLVVSKVVQKTFIEVHEAGTEAGASTGVEITNKSHPDTEFIADHPFLFLISYRLKNKNYILFFGKLTQL